MLIPFMIIYLSRAGMTPTQIGWITGSGWVIGAFISPFIGYLSDRWGHRRIYSIVLTIWAISYFLFWFANGFWAYLIIGLVNGVGRNCMDSLVLTRLFDQTKEQKEILANLNYIAINGGAMIGPLIGTICSKYVGGEIFLVSGAICILILVIEPLFIRKVQQKEQHEIVTLKNTFRVVIKDRPLIWYVLSGILFSILYIQLEFSLPIVMKAEGLFDWYPFIVLTAALISILFSAPILAFQQRYSGKLIAGWISLLFFSGFLFYIPGLLPLYFIGIVLITISEVIFFPMWRAAISHLNPKMQGTYLGVTNFSYLGYAIGSVVGGNMYESFGKGYTFGLFSIISLFLFVTFAIGLTLSKYRYRKQSSEAFGATSD
jgi:MFS family permease